MNGMSSEFLHHAFTLETIGVLAIAALVALLVLSIRHSREIEVVKSRIALLSKQVEGVRPSVGVPTSEFTAPMQAAPTAPAVVVPRAAATAAPSAPSVGAAGMLSDSASTVGASRPSFDVASPTWQKTYASGATAPFGTAPAYDSPTMMAAGYAGFQGPETGRDGHRDEREHGGSGSKGARMESWLGRNAIGVIASALVFLGLVFLGITFVPQLPDAAKVALMFAISGILAVAGSVLALVRRNGFTCALMGCGAGSLFISVLVTHVYFGMIGEVAAYTLLLAWTVACLALLRKTQSLMLSIVVQLGLAISVCMGYAGGLDLTRLALLIVYQLAASAVVVGGNSLFYRTAYRSSIVLALALGFVACWCMMSSVGNQGIVAASEIPYYVLGSIEGLRIPISFACVVQALQASALIALLLRSVSVDVRTGETGDVRLDIPAPRRRSAQMAAATVLWFAVVRFAANMMTYLNLRESVGSVGPFSDAQICMMIAVFVTLALATGLAVSSVAFAKRHDIALDRGPITAVLTVLFVCGALVTAELGMCQEILSETMPLPWMWVWVLFAIWTARATGKLAYRKAALALLAVDAAYLAFEGFSLFECHIGEAGAILLGVACVVGLAGFAGVVVRSLKPSSAGIVVFTAASTALFMAYLCQCTPLADEGYQLSLACMAVALACVAAGFRQRVGGLRLYGLVLVIACVAKLVLLDASGLDSLARVGAFVAGGTICFAISALYNFAVRRL